MEQRILFDEDNNLVVKTDNGIVGKEGFKTFIKGYFIVSALDVEKLLALHTDNVIYKNSADDGYLISKDKALELAENNVKKAWDKYAEYKKESLETWDRWYTETEQLKSEISRLKKRGLIARILNM